MIVNSITYNPKYRAFIGDSAIMRSFREPIADTASGRPCRRQGE